MAQTNLEHHADVRFGSDYSRKHVADIDLVGAFTTLILSFLNKLKKTFLFTTVFGSHSKYKLQIQIRHIDIQVGWDQCCHE